MKVVLFCHSLLSDWNNGNAHFQRGILSELVRRGHSVRAFEPEDAWSVQNLISDAGPDALDGMRLHYPELNPERYRLAELDLDEALDAADVVIVHEWNTPELVARLGQHRLRVGRYLLFYHDTHHRMITAPEQVPLRDLALYDGVLAFGESLSEHYRQHGFGARVWTWHEAADTRVFRPHPDLDKSEDLVWVGNFGDEERSLELREFLFDPARRIGLRGSVYGVRYPAQALSLSSQSGLTYRSWLANYRVPRAFARFRATVHVPRRAYVESLPGIPTIRPFEAMACGIPLVSAPWADDEGLFHAGTDYLLASNGRQMEQHLRAVLQDRALADALASAGLARVLSQHTCAHRVEQLLGICRGLSLRALAAALDQPGAVLSAAEGA